MKRAVFFDRDGVLNELVFRNGGFYSPQSFAQFKIMDSPGLVINKLKKKGFLCIVVSNQPDISRENLKKIELDKMTKVLKNFLIIDDVLYCMHDDIDNCSCRKPLPGLLIKAAKKWEIDLKKSFMIGDSLKDYDAAKNAKVDFILLSNNYNIDIQCSNKINNLKDIFKYIKG